MFSCGETSYPAFSGNGRHINSPLSACIPDIGPIPPGRYFIFDRQSGGILGIFYDLFTHKDQWFALYSADSEIDDASYCDAVRRGNFRLHPKGVRGISKGCITIDKSSDFQRIRLLLKNSTQVPVPGTELLAYGIVTVK